MRASEAALIEIHASLVGLCEIVRIGQSGLTAEALLKNLPN